MILVPALFDCGKISLVRLGEDSRKYTTNADPRNSLSLARLRRVLHEPRM